MTRLLSPASWAGHLLMVLAVAAATWLGLWQLHAWQAHRDAASHSLAAAKPLPLAGVMGGDDPFPGKYLGQPVTLSGHWIKGDTFYISGRERAGHQGYWVVSPLLVDGTRSAMPVVRGWSTTPHAAPATGTAQITGWLQFGESAGLTDDQPHDDVLPEMRIASLVPLIDADLYSGYVIAKTASPAQATTGLDAVSPKDAPEPSSFTALRNFLYAIQWWVFGLFALVVWFRWCRDVVHPPEPEPVDA